MLDKITRDKVDYLVSNIYQLYNLNIKEPLNVYSFAQQLGFVFANLKEDVLKDVKGIILIVPGDKKIKKEFGSDKLIGLNTNLSMEDNNLIIAHELGHYFLDSKRGSVYFAHKFTDNSIEVSKRSELVANYFAAALLLPKESFINLYNSSNDKNNFVSFISNKYMIPKKCVERRIKELMTDEKR